MNALLAAAAIPVLLGLLRLHAELRWRARDRKPLREVITQEGTQPIALTRLKGEAIHRAITHHHRAWFFKPSLEKLKEQARQHILEHSTWDKAENQRACIQASALLQNWSLHQREIESTRTRWLRAEERIRLPSSPRHPATVACASLIGSQDGTIVLIEYKAARTQAEDHETLQATARQIHESRGRRTVSARLVNLSDRKRQHLEVGDTHAFVPHLDWARWLLFKLGIT